MLYMAFCWLGLRFSIDLIKNGLESLRMNDYINYLYYIISKTRRKNNWRKLLTFKNLWFLIKEVNQ
jgi:hypothetical protein